YASFVPVQAVVEVLKCGLMHGGFSPSASAVPTRSARERRPGPTRGNVEPWGSTISDSLLAAQAGAPEGFPDYAARSSNHYGSPADTIHHSSGILSILWQLTALHSGQSAPIAPCCKPNLCSIFLF